MLVSMLPRAPATQKDQQLIKSIIFKGLARSWSEWCISPMGFYVLRNHNSILEAKDLNLQAQSFLLRSRAIFWSPEHSSHATVLPRALTALFR